MAAYLFVFIIRDLVLCSEDQWDIYKLDPEYDCYVPASPNLTIISRREAKARASPLNTSSPSADARYPSPSHNSKRRPPTPTSEERPPIESRKRARHHVTISDDSSEDGDDPQHSISASDYEEEDEVEDLVAGDVSNTRRTNHARHNNSARGASHRERASKLRDMEENRRRRRERIAARIRNTTSAEQQDQEMMDVTMDYGASTPRTQSDSPANTGKRKSMNSNVHIEIGGKC